MHVPYAVIKFKSKKALAFKFYYRTMHVHGVTLSISTIFYRNGLTDHRESMQIVDQGVTSNVGDILMRLRKRAYQIHVEQKSDF